MSGLAPVLIRVPCNSGSRSRLFDELLGVRSLGSSGVLGPEGASREERRFGTGPSFVRMTEGRAARRGRVDWSADVQDTMLFTGEQYGAAVRQIQGGVPEGPNWGTLRGAPVGGTLRQAQGRL